MFVWCGCKTLLDYLTVYVNFMGLYCGPKFSTLCGLFNYGYKRNVCLCLYYVGRSMKWHAYLPLHALILTRIVLIIMHDEYMLDVLPTLRIDLGELQ